MQFSRQSHVYSWWVPCDATTVAMVKEALMPFRANSVYSVPPW